ncbi:type II toxin-antitoxin system RelE/ParE family toxin [Bordetella sp. 02P26C-1]|uniref:type II toxin-antitoxin system RelE/ParE family toxin n=1 Tax=Bordetella sp. 02P26C-1 TaxID=2683195 RepID=UPI001355A4CC|nr:type II toxin-antitoxin system RelE/ParE family toxin [Bordetella sp. 02P26C-1]MVW78814.1 type II toxin-antitoxin system RelE/ParE family toxin [Bordetella sp. 02P26C-1]
MWSRLSATPDLDAARLYRFLAAQDAAAAQRAVKAHRVGVKILTHQPRIGRPLDDMELEFREWLIEFGNSGYVALYRFDSENIVILAVRPRKESGY